MTEATAERLLANEEEEPKLDNGVEDTVKFRRVNDVVMDGKTDDHDDGEEEELVAASHLFMELTSLDELSFPTTSSARIKVRIVR